MEENQIILKLPAIADCGKKDPPLQQLLRSFLWMKLTKQFSARRYYRYNNLRSKKFKNKNLNFTKRVGRFWPVKIRFLFRSKSW